jgi:indole-3-acetate monooxygenase
MPSTKSWRWPRERRRSPRPRPSASEGRCRRSSARAYLHDRIAEGWRRTVDGDDLTLEDKAELLLASVQAIHASAATVDAAFSVAGTSAIHRGTRLERHLRDIAVLKQQGFVSESRFETFAQVRLGLAPELGFVAL